jgi:hypothetical protein
MGDDENLPHDTAAVLLRAIKKQAEGWERQDVLPAAAPALKELAEAYAWLQRPIRGTSR